MLLATRIYMLPYPDNKNLFEYEWIAYASAACQWYKFHVNSIVKGDVD